MEKINETTKQLVSLFVVVVVVIVVSRSLVGHYSGRESVREGRIQTIDTLENQYLVNGVVESYKQHNDSLVVGSEEKSTTKTFVKIQPKKDILVVVQETGGKLIFEGIIAKEYRIKITSTKIVAGNVSAQIKYTEPGKATKSTNYKLRVLPGSIELKPFYSITKPVVSSYAFTE